MTGKTAQVPAEIITSPSNKRTLLIIVVVVVVLALFALAGIFVNQSSESSSSATVNMPETKKQTTVKTENGELTIKEGELPKNIPKDITIYKGSKVKRSSEGKEGVVITLQTTDSVGKVTEFYREDLKKNEWNSIESNIIEGSSLLTANKDDRQLAITVVINEKEGKTEISIVVGLQQ